MLRRIAVLLVLMLAACSAPAVTPTATSAPTAPFLATQAPIGPTILPSDLGNANPTTAGSQALPAATDDAAGEPTAVPTSSLPATPVAVGFDYALRPQFAQDLNLVENKTVYTIHWDLNDDLSQLTGTQRVIFANRTGKPLNEVYFRLFANYPGDHGKILVSNVQVSGASAQTALEAQNTALRVKLTRPLEPGRVIPIQMDYVVTPPTDNEVRYADFTRTEWITTLPTVYPLIPAYDAQGWHIEVPPPYGDLVYAESSIYDVTITTPSQYKVIASGQLVQEINQGARTERRFIGAPMRDFDVNISSSLVKSTLQVNDVTLNSYYQAADTDSGRRALQWMANALKVYQTRFGPYPFKELDLVETPTSAGGIEYPGLITVASALYQDPGQTGFFEFATVHETAHQWFYSTIGNDQVNHPWLDEALVQYASLIYFQDTYGVAEGRLIKQNFFDRPLAAAIKKYGDRPAGLPVGAYDEDSYGAFIYDKAPNFFQAVRDQIGDADFFTALQTYYQNFKYRIAQPQDLVNAFNQASGQDVTPLYNKWIGG